MTQSRQDNDDRGLQIMELVLGEHTLLIAFAALILFGAYFVFIFYGRSKPLSTVQLPDLTPIEVVAGTDGSAPVLVSQRHPNSRGPIRIGIISGHLNHDSGAVCEDGLTEATVVRAISDKVIANLNARSLDAELLSEYDPRIGPQYEAYAVVSIHADACTGPGATLSGFKAAASLSPQSPLLQRCIEDNYQAGTQLPYNENTITADMIDYHVFNKLPPTLPAIILETGFLNMDRNLLTANSDVPAKAIADGIVCFVENSQ
ncbi:MAG: N-acetylmuramoyl-L-alanine amidase [Candidatus Promineifilaceae bacterium]